MLQNFAIGRAWNQVWVVSPLGLPPQDQTYQHLGRPGLPSSGYALHRAPGQGPTPARTLFAVLCALVRDYISPREAAFLIPRKGLFAFQPMNL